MSQEIKFDKRKFLQFSTIASRASVVACKPSKVEYPIPPNNLSLGNGFIPRKLEGLEKATIGCSATILI